MHQRIQINENNVNFVFEITDGGDVRLVHFSPLPYDEARMGDVDKRKKYRLVELQCSGENIDIRLGRGSKHTGTQPGNRLKYKLHKQYRNDVGLKLEVVTEDGELRVTSHVQFFDGIPVIKSWSELENLSTQPVGIEYISSFSLVGLDKEGLRPWEEKSRLHIPHNTWYGEAQWQCSTLQELGLSHVNSVTTKRLGYSSSGTWSSHEYLPMGCFENTESGTSLIWQIEHNGSWHWEIGDTDHQLYLLLSGPTENENHWWKELRQGEKFISVPVAVGVVSGDFTDAVGALTQYRRVTRRPNKDNMALPVIFNDYMNCLVGNPTTDQLIPLIDAAAETGCEYFCIDCGWYSDGPWWDGVGEWLPSKSRFPGGIKHLLDYIRSRGMIPGLWLELEVMGIKCSLTDKLPEEAFFQRHGKRVTYRNRYQLDFRHTDVIRHADDVVDRLVNEYGVGYIKMDYNVNAGIGTEVDVDSLGDGLLAHNRAYLKWLDRVFERYPDLVIENCGSGGMRMDYAMLSRHSIQSTTDQTDYRKNAIIAAASPTAVTPEQSAIWSYPLRNGDPEEVIFNMVNSMFQRVHQSGHLAELSSERKLLVKEGLEYYKKIRDDIRRGLPLWPLGLPSFLSKWLCLGLTCDSKLYLSVWRLDSQENNCDIPLSFLKGKQVKVRLAYPLEGSCETRWIPDCGVLKIGIPNQYCARIFELSVH